MGLSAGTPSADATNIQISKNEIYRDAPGRAPLAASFCSHGGEAYSLTQSKQGPVFDWQQSNTHRPVSEQCLG